MKKKIIAPVAILTAGIVATVIGLGAVSSETAAPESTASVAVSTPTPKPTVTTKTVTRAPCTAITAGSTDPIFEQTSSKPVIIGTTMVPVGESAWAITVRFLDGTGATDMATWINQNGAIYNGDPASAAITDWPQYDTSSIDMTDLGDRITDCIVDNL